MYDAIVVGARCAGASLAMLLARKGYRVLLTDRATFPSDHTMSTHLVWQNGTNRLRKWGLLDTVAASNCPPMSSFFIDFGDFRLDGEPTPLPMHVPVLVAEAPHDNASLLGRDLLYEFTLTMTDDHVGLELPLERLIGGVGSLGQ